MVSKEIVDNSEYLDEEEEVVGDGLHTHPTRILIYVSGQWRLRGVVEVIGSLATHSHFLMRRIGLSSMCPSIRVWASIHKLEHQACASL